MKTKLTVTWSPPAPSADVVVLFSGVQRQPGVVAKGARGGAQKGAGTSRGFTLVELLIVIAVIALLAAILLPVIGSVVKHSVIQRAQSERDQLQTAIEGYKGHFGYYPPSNALGLALTNQLYYELFGTTTTNNGGAVSFTTLDNSSTISQSPTPTIMNFFGVSGIMNCSQGSGEDAHTAENFFAGVGLKPGRIATNTSGVFVIVTGAASDSIYKPMPGFNTVSGNANPWRYLNPGVNNPSSYDLWVQIVVGGKTNLICNWKSTPTINSPLP